MSSRPWFQPKRFPNEVIGDLPKPYLLRWWLARKSRIKVLENLYLHHVL